MTVYPSQQPWFVWIEGVGALPRMVSAYCSEDKAPLQDSRRQAQDSNVMRFNSDSVSEALVASHGQ